MYEERWTQINNKYKQNIVPTQFELKRHEQGTHTQQVKTK